MICEICGKQESMAILYSESDDRVEICEVCFATLLGGTATDIYDFEWAIVVADGKVRVTAVPKETR